MEEPKQAKTELRVSTWLPCIRMPMATFDESRRKAVTWSMER